MDSYPFIHISMSFDPHLNWTFSKNQKIEHNGFE